MPRFPSDMEKARAYTERQKAELEVKRKERAAKQAADEKAFAELRAAVAKEWGVAPEKVTMFMCRRGRR